MARRPSNGVSEQAKAGKHRMDDARALLEARRWRGAMYMAGYSIEGRLKSKLMPFEGSVIMAEVKLKRKIRKTLKETYFKDPQDLVDVSDGPDDSIHVVVVSRKFDGRRMKEKNDMIWSILVQKLRPEEWGQSFLVRRHESRRDQSIMKLGGLCT